jgi:hypothetical protein
MRRWNRAAVLLGAASLLIGATHPGCLSVGEAFVILSKPASQVDPNSLGPSVSGQVTPAPHRTEQDTNRPEPFGLKEYLDSSEEISLLGISSRIEERKAEQEIQGPLVVDIAPGSPGAAAGLRPSANPPATF